MMSIDYISVSGYKGYSEEQILNLAISSNKLGSGLTIITGANNSGKSAIFEILNFFSTIDDITFEEQVRNLENDKKVNLKIGITNTDKMEEIFEISTHPGGGSSTIRKQNRPLNFVTLPAKRFFNKYFTHSSYVLVKGYGSEKDRLAEQNKSMILSRLFDIYQNPERFIEFNELLKKIANISLHWKIERLDEQLYISIEKGKNSHNSRELGNGLVSLLYIVEVLYSSGPGDLIIIDEPELSLHASLQKKLCKAFSEYATDKQIVIITHSPYLIDLNALKNGANLCRIYQVNNASYIKELSQKSKDNIAALMGDICNPHILGINACEVFCLEGNIFLVEGAEDVIFYPKVLEQLDIDIDGEFYGWGVGGAGNIEKIAQIVDDLGFEKVVGIVDNDKVSELASLQNKFPKFNFYSIPAYDVRFKKAQPKKEEKEGLLDKSNIIKSVYIDETKELFNAIKLYFNS